MATCEAAGDGWVAGGRIANGTGDDHDYAITVLFTNAAATVIGVGETHVSVTAGSSADWKLTARFAPASPTLCVLAGVA